ncbi:MAG: glycosyltransferase, partial [Planctomycetaceae bacterium]
MRIGYVSTYPPIECGIATYTQALEGAVRDRGHETFVVSYHGAEGRNVFPVVPNNDSPNLAAEVFTTSSKLTPDLMHIQHEYGLFGPQRGAAVCDLLVRFRIARIPVVTTLHTVYESLTDDQEIVLRHVIADSDAVIVHEAFQKETLERAFGPQQKIKVVEHGVREISPIPEAKAKLGLAGKKVVMLCGYFRRSKGFHKAAAFLPELCDADPDVVLVMAGKVRGTEALEYQRELFETLRSSPYGDRIVFLRGQFPQHTFDTVLSAADVVVLPYDLGAQSGMLSQCLALQRPVVTSDLPAFRAILERAGGGLVSESDDGYAAAILRLLHDED